MSLILQDTSSQLWLITVDDNGVLYSTPVSSGTPTTLVLNDSTNASSWNVVVSTGGILQATPATLGVNPTAFGLVTWNLEVSLAGIIEIDRPPAPAISVLAQQSQTFPVLILLDITSIEDGSTLHLSQMGCTFGGNTYTAKVLSVGGFEQSLESSRLGIMAIPDISITLGDADGSMTAWDNAHLFKGARITVTLIFWNPVTKVADSSDYSVIFKGICNAPDQVTPTQMMISAFSRFNTEYLLLPVARISQFSQTTFPGEGAQDCDDANAGGGGPTNPNSAGYAWYHGASQNVGGLTFPIIQAKDAFLPYFSCGYGPLRSPWGFGSSNPLGNFLVAQATATAGLCSTTTIGNSGASYPASNGLQNHIAVIISGKGAGQARRIASNTSTQITVANPFTTAPDGTSEFGVLYGFCGKSQTDCQARGMYGKDSQIRTTQRFQGIIFIPLLIGQYNPSGIPFGHLQSANQDFAKYNQPIPIIYGTAVVNLIELTSILTTGKHYVYGIYLVGLGPCSNITNVLAGGTLLPAGNPATYDNSAPATGKWVSQNGAIGVSFADPNFPAMEPHSGMCVVFAKFPDTFLQNGSTFGSGNGLSAQITGLPLWQADASGLPQNLSYIETPPGSGCNPAWVILDILFRSGWQATDLDLASFYAFSVYANQLININVSSTETSPSPRFTISLAITQQTPASEILRQVMASCHAILSYNSSGQLRIDCENRLTNTTLQGSVIAGVQWAEVEDGAGITIGSVLTVGPGVFAAETVTVTNVQLDGTGQFFQFQANFTHPHAASDPVTAAPSYAFSLSSIELDGSRVPALTRSSLKTSDTPNEYSAMFEDSLRTYVVDTVNLVNTQEANNFGAPVIGDIQATGFTTVDAATRIAQLALFKSHGRRGSANNVISRGNLFVSLNTSIKGFPAAIGTVVSLTYAKESWTNKLFRVTGISPTPDAEFPYWRIKVTLREHDDGWYDIINGNIPPIPSFVPIQGPPTGPRPPIRIGHRPGLPRVPLFN